MATTGYAAVQYHSLTNTDGEVVYETKLRDTITDQSIKVADKINGDYTYQQADVFFKTAYDVNPPSLQEKEEMTTRLRQQAEKSKQGYAMMPVEMTDEVAHLSVTYQNGEDKIEAMIHNLTGKSDPTSYIDEKVEFKQEKVYVKGVEMLQTEFAPSRAIELQWIY
ncbi:hypothetical protein [Paenibacillus tundrae]|uniref:hypothetical protein n=1 Tax=Paenibacillus tundrae TaxID=528187 RepID=UPI0030CB1A07